MKKNFLALCALSAIALTGVVSCGSGSEDEKEDNIINISFVPSRDSQDLTETASALAKVLNKIVPEYEYKINVGTSYAAVTEALLSEQADIGFLTASGFAQIETTEPGKVDVLMTSVRDGYQVQIDVGNGQQSEEIRKQQVEAMNSKDYKCSKDNKTYLGQQTEGKENQVNFYNSVCFVLSDAERAKLGKPALDKNKDGKVTVDELAGTTVALQGQTSGAGYLYPSFFLNNLKNEANRNVWFGANWNTTITNTDYLNKNGMTFVDNGADASKGQIKGVKSDGGYDAAFQNVMSGQVDAAFGFMDIRYTQGFNKESSSYYHDEDLWKKTVTVCMTTPIYNDTISARATLSQAKKDAIKRAFKGAAADGKKDEKGTGAYLLYNIYSHTGYKDAKASDFASEVEMYKWKVANGK